jgi:hypothetical protein
MIAFVVIHCMYCCTYALFVFRCVCLFATVQYSKQVVVNMAFAVTVL